MARITGQNGNSGAKSIHRRIVRASPVSVPGWAWSLSISVGRDLRDPPARPCPGAQVCSALAHTAAWLLPPSAVSSLDRPPHLLTGASSRTRARNCSSHPGPQLPTPRARGPGATGLQTALSALAPRLPLLALCTLLFLLDPHQSVSVPRKVWRQKTELAKMLSASPSLLLRPSLPPTRGFIPFPRGLLSPVTAQPPADRPQAPAALLLPAPMPILQPLHLLCSRGPRARAPSWHSPAC